MNWKEIKQKYPEAWEEFLDSKHFDRLEPRRLYDFFDEYGIHVGIDKRLPWSYWIETDEDEFGEHEYYEYGNYDTRTKCEAEAFEKAFRILEKNYEKPN